MKSPVASIKQHKTASLGLLLFCLVVAAHFPSVFNDFVNFDDPDYVYNNQHVIRGLSPGGILWAFGSLDMGFWHPLTWISLMLDGQVFGARALGFHLTNIILHAGNAVLVFLFLQQLTGAPGRSGLAAMLFGAHPLHVEAVAWVAERKEMLSAFFALAALLAYGRYGRKAQAAPETAKPTLEYFGAIVFFALSLMSKAMWVTLPAVLLLLDWWPLKRISLRLSRGHFVDDLKQIIRSKVLAEKIPFVILALGCGALTVIAQHQMSAVRTAGQFPFSARVANAVHSYGTYLAQMIWPSDLVVFYPLPKVVPFWPTVGACLIIVTISVVSIRFLEKAPYLLFGWAWYLITLLPVIGLFQVGIQAHADRYTYVPLIGIFVCLAWVIPSSGEWVHLRPGVVTICGVALALIFALTRHQISFWKNSETLFRHALAINDDNELAHNNLAAALAGQGRFQEAIVHLRRAISLKPKDAKARSNLGIALVNLGNTKEAIPQLQQALALNPSDALAHENLGFALLNQGDLSGAILHLGRAVQLKPDYAVAYRNLGIAVGSQGNLGRAIGYFQKAIALEPNDVEARYNLGVADASMGKIAEAIAEYRKVLALEPRHADAENNLGAMLASEGKLDEGIKHLENALRLNPNHADARNNLSAALAAKSQADKQKVQRR